MVSPVTVVFQFKLGYNFPATLNGQGEWHPSPKKREKNVNTYLEGEYIRWISWKVSVLELIGQMMAALVSSSGERRC